MFYINILCFQVDLAEFISTRLAPDVVTHLVQHVHSYRKGKAQSENIGVVFLFLPNCTKNARKLHMTILFREFCSFLYPYKKIVISIIQKETFFQLMHALWAYVFSWQV